MIYGLTDPLEPEEIRYIGKAEHWQRPCSHEKEVLRTKDRTYKIYWILKLLSEGRTYDIITIEEFSSSVTRKELCDAERFYIAKYRAEGHRLTNGTEGGEGGKPCPEAIAKQAQSMRERWEDPEYHARGVEAAKKTYQAYTDEEKARFSWVGKSHKIQTLIKMGKSQRERFSKPEQHAYHSASSKERFGITNLQDPRPLEKRIFDTQKRIKIWSKEIEKDGSRKPLAIDKVKSLNQRLVDLQSQQPSV